MTPPREPYDSRDIDELAATDALLDRLGARAPSADDLDDPLIAALALLAAEVDLDAVPLDVTRAALESAGTDLDVPPAPIAGHDRHTGLVLGPRNVADDEPVAGPVRAHSAPPDADLLRKPRRRVRRPEPGPTAVAPPRSLPRTPSRGPQGTRPGEKRERRMRPVTVLVVAIAAIVLGSGVSAALTGGRTLNPLSGIQQVVEEITHGRTAEQAQAYQKAQDLLKQADAAAKGGDKALARELIGQIKLDALSPDDAKRVGAQIEAIRQRVGS
jgi:hypothetical protein